ncbi:MAG TPA: hypothetical protein HPP51_05970 [Planctomycetes bacterium]|nr:hypothetical protein [Planctomycetota bacterium]
MKKAAFFLALAELVLCGSCSLLGIMGSKTYHEQRVPAEFLLKDAAQGGVLVFADETGAGRSEQGLRSELDEMVRMYLVKKARIKSKNLISNDKLSHLRSRRDDFSALSPVELGTAAGAAAVLYIMITDYELYEVGNREYFGGSLVTRSILFDVASQRVLWPADGRGRVVDVGVEVETGGREASLDRLITATAHCITRSFYDCPKPEFRAADERFDYSHQW